MADGLIEDKSTVLMDANVGSAEEERVSTSQDDHELMLTARKLWRRDMDHAREWRVEAKEDFDFAAGRQYPEGEAKGPQIMFDRLGPVIDAVSGLEIQNRQEVRYIPRTEGDAQVNEILTSAAEFFRDECMAEDEDTDAFRDTAICGMGWTEDRLDFDENPEGEYKTERRDPLDMLWDSAARARNLSDRRRTWHVREYSLDEAEEMFPDFSPADLHAGWASDILTTGGAHNADPNMAYRQDNDDDSRTAKSRIRIVHFEWVEKRHVGYKIAGPDGSSQEIPVEEYDALEVEEGQEKPKGVKVYRKEWQHAFLGNVVLARATNLCPEHSAFDCITGKRDRNKGTFYGIVRLSKDPQRWANKFMSQSMQIMNVNAKGGVMAKRSAFESDLQAETTWADPTKVTWLSDTYQEGDVRDKPSPVLPNNPDKFMEYAISAIRDSSGVNLELLGLRDANQAGVLEAQRKQAGMTILAHLFDNRRRFSKSKGLRLLYFIQNYLSDGRLIRIVGEEAEQYVALRHESGVAKYDVIVDDSPTSPNQKEMVWATVMQMMPLLQNSMPPQVLSSLMKYSPLPTKVVTEMAEAMEQAQAAQAEQAQQMQEIEAAKINADIGLKEAQAEKTRAEAQGENVDTMIKVVTPVKNPNAPSGQGSVQQGGAPQQGQQQPANADVLAALAADLADLERTMIEGFTLLVENEYAPEIVNRAPDGTAQGIQKMRPQDGF